ncbi:hypothetical protein QWY85_15335 [Neolewinella lacunae]|uniref:Uncharacterized protein n=1 Tax=Neolewinella lacunae TaxID=1517758 RepID=A0A923PHG6_9BACT|nr:hypothetical protein [Neolewinella lacunae]MBC6992796.1 hypothetical protein [Neolewinella lacunae]MDN3636040.1 hypothetical protein [Neolewinella lacunae]
MLSLFRTNQAYAGLLLFLYALVLQLPLFLGGGEPRPPYTGGGVLGTWLMEQLAQHRNFALLLPVLLVGVQGVQANTLATRHQLSRVVTQFPGLFLVLMWAVVPAFRWLHPIQVANVFLLFALLSLGRLYKRNEPAVALFNAGAWLGVASLFFPEYLFFLPAFLIGVGVLGRPEPRSLLQVTVGLLTVYFLMGTWHYFRGTFVGFLTLQFSVIGLADFMPATPFSLAGLALLALLILVLITLSGRIQRLLNIEGSKGINIQFWVLLSSLTLVLFGATVYASFAQVAVVPLGILLGLAIVEAPVARANFFHLLLFSAALVPGLLW